MKTNFNEVTGSRKGTTTGKVLVEFVDRPIDGTARCPADADPLADANQKPRKDRAKDSAPEAGASRKASAGGRRDGKVTAGDFKPLPETATLDERAAYIREHAGAAMRCRRLELGYSWCAGVEIAKVKDLTGLTGKEWDAHCDETFGFSSRHARDFTAVAMCV